MLKSVRSTVDLSSQATGTLSVTNGGTGTTTQFTAGSVVFAGSSGVYSQDNTNLFWDDTNNRLGIGVNAPSATIHTKGSGTTSATLSFRAQNSSSVDTLYVRDDGAVSAPLVESAWTTASAANVFIGSGGFLYKSTSSMRYKTDIQDATHGLNEVMKLRSVTYNGINDGDTRFGGLIAEEVHEAGLTEFVVYNDNGDPDALHYGHMVSLLVKAIQELNAKIVKLEGK